ncbi:DNA mismatch endonuclease Vsr [Mesorhizobium sp. BR1-1-6]|uniref:very short patch repair endonuclease n=1 Tax=Mesorhizobium sp. BR1-1-6 TaxID=2876648 RepID=UPI001CD0F949|nr:DNA mismatch endonuclease Vsr [Mesorhizobium sp. BR1-1-6]MBZ9892953.1 DNA mismatch endonuclease Vsr [Mesorhizobium sp. BR1-1-6]
MVDFLSTEQRSERMSRIRSKDTSPELALRRALHALGLRFRVHYRRLPGTPDIVLPKFKTVVLVHGCFWHRHAGCKVASTPKSRTPFWQEKFDRNVHRDQQNTAALEERGWKVMVAWECELGSQRKVDEVARRVASEITLPGR